MPEEIKKTEPEEAPGAHSRKKAKKSKKKGSWVYNLILVLLFGVMLFSGYQIFSKVIEYRKAKDIYENLENEVVKVVDGPVIYRKQTAAQTQPDATKNGGTAQPGGATQNGGAAQPGGEGTAQPGGETDVNPGGSTSDPLDDPTQSAGDVTEETRHNHSGNDSDAVSETIRSAPTTTLYPEPQGDLPWLAIDFDQLLAQNKDVVGWLYGQGGHINLPVAQGTNNSYYLHHMLDGSYNFAGTLFVDFRNLFLLDDICIIYGHKMRNDTMFGLLELWDDYEYYLANPVMRLYTPDAIYELQIMASIYTDIREIMVFNFGSEQAFNEGVQSLLDRALYPTGVTAEYGDKLICLYTCAYQVENGRRYMFCKVVQIA